MMRVMFRPWKRLLMRALGINSLIEQQAVTRQEMRKIGEWHADMRGRVNGLVEKEWADVRRAVEDVRALLTSAPPDRQQAAVLEIQRLLTDLAGPQLTELRGVAGEIQRLLTDLAGPQLTELRGVTGEIQRLVTDVSRKQEAVVPDWLLAALPGDSPAVVREKVTRWVEADRAGRLLTLEYPPSYDLSPRWGYRIPPHEGLTALFDRDSDGYLDVFRHIVELTPDFRRIKTEFSHDTPGEPAWFGGPTNAVDLASVYHFMVTARPRTYLEIGSGLTTLFAARAKADHDLPTRIVSIDPNPRAVVDAQCDEVIRKPLELYDLSAFDRLEPGDIVFMDGSHRTFMNSDVTVFMLDVLPRLKPGVLIHFHDITLPCDYSNQFVSWYWSEQYILATYLLAAADRVRVLLPNWYAAQKPEACKILRPLATAGWSGPSKAWLYGGSFWFTHV